MAKGSEGRLRPLHAPLAAVLAATALALAAGCGEQQASEAPRRVVEVQQAARDRWAYARERFGEMCAGCHSLIDAGARGPRFDLDRTGGIDEARARYAIAEGEPGMPPWKDVLSAREFEELVAYLTAVARDLPGEDDWRWQFDLRREGNDWTPEDTIAATEAASGAGE